MKKFGPNLYNWPLDSLVFRKSTLYCLGNDLIILAGQCGQPRIFPHTTSPIWNGILMSAKLFVFDVSISFFVQRVMFHWSSLHFYSMTQFHCFFLCSTNAVPQRTSNLRRFDETENTSMYDNDNVASKLPSHRRCVSHYLNLIPKDIEKELLHFERASFALVTTFGKLKTLWVLPRRSVSSVFLAVLNKPVWSWSMIGGVAYGQDR